MKELALKLMMGTIKNVFRPGFCVFLAVSTFAICANIGLAQAGESRYVLDEITSPSLEGNLLGTPTTRPMWVWLPPSYDTSPDKHYPTIYVLHHFTGTRSSFKSHEFVDLDIGGEAANLIREGLMDEAILIMPEASNIYGGSFYQSNEVIGDYQTYIANELVDYIDGKYRTTADRESRSVLGHSMGGFGAFTFALNYPEVFGGVASLAPANAEFEASGFIERFISENPETLGEPLIVQTPADYMAIVMTSFATNAMYANAAALSPNPDNPPFYVDLPVQYPEQTVVEDVWNQWLDNDLVSQIGRNGNNLTNTNIYIDTGVGEVTIMPELFGTELLPAALDEHGLNYTYVEAEGDHLSHLRVRTIEALKFLSPPGTYVLEEITSPALEGNLLGDPATRPMWVWLPPSYETSPEKQYPTVYLLHGFTGDHNQFKYGPMLNLNIGEMASILISQGRIDEVIIVMPDASNVFGGSFYESNEVLGDYQGYIAHDIVNYIDGKYRTISDRDNRGIAGNSMGADGALSIAMNYPEVFGAVAAMSPSADFELKPNHLDAVIAENPETLAEPTLVHNTAELDALLFIEFWANIFYAEAVAFSPNPDNPPYYVDLPLQYPEKTVVEDVWNKWLEHDSVSRIEQDGQNLINTEIFIDVGVGPVTFMPEGEGIELLLAALIREGLEYTFVASPGDHLSHLRERTTEVLKFLSSARSTTSNE